MTEKVQLAEKPLGIYRKQLNGMLLVLQEEIKRIEAGGPIEANVRSDHSFSVHSLSVDIGEKDERRLRSELNRSTLEGELMGGETERWYVTTSMFSIFITA